MPPFKLTLTCTLVLEVTVEAEAVKVAVVKPAATVTDDGTETLALLLVTARVLPPGGAAVFNVTVQIELPGPVRAEGVQLRALGFTTGCTVTVVVLLTPPALAVMVADFGELGVPAVTVKLALLAPAGTVSEDGVLRLLLLSERLTVNGLEGAAVSPTVQVPLEPAGSVVGLQDSEASAGLTARFSQALTEVPFSAAVI